MELKLTVRYWFLIFLMLFQMQESNGYFEEERLGLLELKAFFLSYNNKTNFDPLPSWVGANYCNWERVKCDDTTGGHVIELLLDRLFNYSSYLNYSLYVFLFQPFKKLKCLDLSNNGLSNFMGNKGLGGFSNLNGLEILDLSANRFDNRIMSSLNGFVSLKKLSFKGNQLEGFIPMHDIAKMRNLEILDLSFNKFFDGAIQLQDLRSLRALDLSYNEFNRTLPIQGLCERNNLVELDISWNSIKGDFPNCMSNFTSLKFLDISSNQFSGNIPSTISQLTGLVYLSLSDNFFHGLFSFSSLANLTNLKVFQLSEIKKLQLETEKPKYWLPTFQLKVLTLRNCNLNRQTSSNIPSFLSSQSDLLAIDLSYNQLFGTFPFWLLQNNFKLEMLNLNDNSLFGTLHLPIFNHPLTTLLISSNYFSGQLPNNMGLSLPKVRYLKISRNSFEGELPSSMEEMKNLRTLDLSSNNFYGELKMYVFTHMPYLVHLLMENNNFSGSIGDGLTNITSLLVLDISKNMISGKVPGSIGNLRNLEYLEVSDNRLEGELPTEICSLQRLVYLDISWNQLLGDIPSCSNFSSLVYLLMRGNYFTGSIPHALSLSSKLRVLDLSHNKLSGRIIPNWLNGFTSLQVLSLKGNEFQGLLIQELCQIRYISILDLSSNRLNGSIPSCISNILFKKLDVSKQLLVPMSDEYYFGLSSQTIFNSSLEFQVEYQDYIFLERQVEAILTWRGRSLTLNGFLLKIISVLDLSDNELTGHIPFSIGDMRQLGALNISHNKLIGPIPDTISNLKGLEILDLSYNLLSGDIPSQLSELDFLAIINVSYNNLSGIIPISNQFASFDESGYLGNSYLCGIAIEKKCADLTLPPSIQSDEGNEDQTRIDMVAFYSSFTASYVITLLAFVTVLYINLHWRKAWFYFISICCSNLCNNLSKVLYSCL